MKSAVLLASACVLAALQLPIVERSVSPFVPMAVTYRAELTRDREAAQADFDAIDTLGFNAVQVELDWASIEPARGAYRFETLDSALGLANEHKLRVLLRLDTLAEPSWLARRYPDGRFIPESNSAAPRPDRACLDHPGVRADVAALVAAASARASRATSWYSLEAATDTARGFCTCPYTQRRFREWQRATYGATPRPPSATASDRAAFAAAQARELMSFVLGAASSRAGRLSVASTPTPSVVRGLAGSSVGQDDWLFGAEVDLYGMTVPPILASAAGPAQVALALDGVRAATRDKGWLATASRELRLSTWASIARGAKGAIFGNWRALVQADGSLTDNARAASGLARIVGHNPGLFAPLQPKPAKAAVIYDPRIATGRDAASQVVAHVHEALFERNVQVDVLHILQIDDLASGGASRYAVIFGGAAASMPDGVTSTLQSYAKAGGTLVLDAASRSKDEIAQLAAKAGAAPVARIEGATGPFETRFLESSDVLVLIALNHADASQRVTMTFAPDTQEAIWQNLETGAGVNFVVGAAGPRYTHTFGPRDALVLMIPKEHALRRGRPALNEVRR